MVTLPRQILAALDLRPGEFVELAQQTDGTFRLRPWVTRDEVTTVSPGVITERLPVAGR